MLAGMKRSLKALDLQSVTALDAATAEVLAKFKGEKISFVKLPEIDVKTAQAITQFKGARLCFPGLKTLDGDTAHALAMSRCWDCELPSLVTLDQETASGMLGTAAFSPSNQRLSFGGLKKLEAATANVLRHYQGNELALDGLAAIDAETAKWLSEAKCKSLALRLNVADSRGRQGAVAV